MDYFKRTWMEIDLDKITHNIRTIRKGLGTDVPMLVAVKANAYGHGDTYIAHHLESIGINWFAVVSIEEGITLRKAGIRGHILVLGYTPPEQAEKLTAYNLIQTLVSAAYARALSAKATEKSLSVRTHVKVDTGMGRSGLCCSDEALALQEAVEIYGLPGLLQEGIYTHFSSADDFEEEGTQYTRDQFHAFVRFCEKLTEKGFDVGIRHCCNSAATIRFPEMQLDMVRFGIIAYGLYSTDFFPNPPDLQVATSLKTVVTMVKEVPVGQSISYSRLYETRSTRTLATLAMGYADGYPRELTNKGQVMIGGKLYPLVGTICMDQCMVDVTGSSVKVGDEVTLCEGGQNDPISWYELEHLSGRYHVEILCLIGQRVTRIYYKNGIPAEISTYKEGNPVLK